MEFTTLPRPTLERIELLAGYELLRENDGLPHSWGQGLVHGDRWWLLAAGRAVGYCKTLLDGTVSEERLRLVDIEVKPEARGQGHARRLTDAIEQATGERLWSDGGFTAEGFSRLAHLPIVSGYEREACYRPQTFVTDWTTMSAKL